MSALPAFSLQQRDAEQLVSAALTSTFGFGRGAAREISEVANCNERTALDWLDGKSTPGFIHTMRLIASVPRFASEVKRITGLEADHHPSFQQEFMALATKYARYLENA